MFITADTLIQHPYDPQLLNRYSYCRNNPIRYTDSDGHLIWFLYPVLWAAEGVVAKSLEDAFIEVTVATIQNHGYLDNKTFNEAVSRGLSKQFQDGTWVNNAQQGMINGLTGQFMNWVKLGDDARKGIRTAYKISNTCITGYNLANAKTPEEKQRALAKFALQVARDFDMNPVDIAMRRIDEALIGPNGLFSPKIAPKETSTENPTIPEKTQKKEQQYLEIGGDSEISPILIPMEPWQPWYPPLKYPEND